MKLQHLMVIHISYHKLIIEMINIFLRKITGKGQKIHINEKATIRQLIQEVNKAFKYLQPNTMSNYHHIQLYHRGKRIEEEIQKHCEEYEIRNNSIIHVVQVIKQNGDQNNQSQKVHLKISIENKVLNYEIQNQKRVGQLKKIICYDLQISQEIITLSHLGSELDDNQQIYRLQISNNTLISANASQPIRSTKFFVAQTLQKEDRSEASQSIPKIQNRESFSPLKRLKKAQSLNTIASFPQTKDKNMSLSMRLNKIEEKNASEKQQSQISEQDSQNEQLENVISLQSLTTTKQKTLESLAKPFIETESIVGDEQQETQYCQCQLEVIRSDRKKQFVFECKNQDTFQDAQKIIAKLQKTQLKNIKLLLGFEDIWKSEISSRQNQIIKTTIQSPSSVKKKRSSSQKNNTMLSVVSDKAIKMTSKILQKAIKQKTQIVNIQYQLLNDI